MQRLEDADQHVLTSCLCLCLCLCLCGTGRQRQHGLSATVARRQGSSRFDARRRVTRRERACARRRGTRSVLVGAHELSERKHEEDDGRDFVMKPTSGCTMLGVDDDDDDDDDDDETD
eukprot:1948718-Rhodomonas_salina.1